MNKIISSVKKYLGELLTTGGTGLLFYNVFDFSHTSGGLLINSTPHYYYYSDTLISIAVGAMLIILGLIIIKNKK